ncbi:HEAT repeat domain-containing protein [Streptomyces sp. NPDC058657]|uniref:HEAT repeat domain-containing protein n=1 Tax=unclassified Streptomyces TaxID=2593676 RepID=UPI00364F9D48
MINEYEKLLAGLDDVDWASLSHAYESAHDVPGHVRTLCGSDDEARKQAFSSLFSSIFHQGSRYSASPLAVPFLARIALTGPTAAREDTMWLLTRLAVDWHDEYDVTTGINVAGWRAAAAEVGPEELLPWYEEQLAAATDADQRAQLQEIQDWVAAGNSPDSRWSALQSYDAVLAGLPGLLALLDDDDARLRTRIAYILAWFPEFSTTSLPRLLALAAHDKDPVTAATALLAAGIVGPSSTAEDITLYLGATDPLMRWAAATALIRLAGLDGTPVGPGLLGRAVTELTAAARSPFDHVTDYCEGDPFGHIERTLHALPPESDPAAAREALDACRAEVRVRGRRVPVPVQGHTSTAPFLRHPAVPAAPHRLGLRRVPHPQGDREALSHSTAVPRTPLHRPDSGAAAAVGRSRRPPARLARPQTG